MRKRTVALIINIICVFLLTFLQIFDHADLSAYSNHPLLTTILKFLLENKLVVVTASALWVSVYGVIPITLYTRKTRNELKKKFLSRILTELLAGDAETHRVTLFKEICYLHAFVLNYIGLIKHLLCDKRWRSRLYLYPPKYGRYLVVDERQGQHYNKSSTMFRVAQHSIEECDGLAGLIRYKGTSVCLPELPKIDDIDFSKIKIIDEIKVASIRKKVDTYMTDGFIKDFNTLRKMHRKSRHFFGTVITKKVGGSYWGVLLIDSISTDNPFTTEVQKRFNSFAISISDIINLEEV